MRPINQWGWTICSIHSSITVVPLTSTIVDAPLFRITLDPSRQNGLSRVSHRCVPKSRASQQSGNPPICSTAATGSRHGAIPGKRYVTPAPKDVVASVLARLRNVAEEAGKSSNYILQSYVIWRFVLWERTSARFPLTRKRHVALVRHSVFAYLGDVSELWFLFFHQSLTLYWPMSTQPTIGDRQSRKSYFSPFLTRGACRFRLSLMLCHVDGGV